MSKGKVLFKLSGSIACYKSCFALSKLVQAGYEIEVVATRSALEFVGEATLEGLTGRPVHVETFERGKYMDHIRLMRWADLICLAPAAANTLAKMASGVGDDLVTTLFLAHDFKKPYLVAPAMNSAMYRHPATQNSLATLKSWGVEFLGTGTGALACGEIGEGRLIEPEELVKAIELRLSERATLAQANPATQEASSSHEMPLRQRGLDLLITSGGTREPIDGVRFITNVSTGKTGAALADALASFGHRVTLLRAEGSVKPVHSSIEIDTYVTFDDLRSKLSANLGKRRFDAVIQAAAVGDYSIERIEAGGKTIARDSKIESSSDLLLKLKANPKLVDELRSHSANPQIKIVAFKLTNGANSASQLSAVSKLAERARPDWIVHNDLAEIDEQRHAFAIYEGKTARPVPILEASRKSELARALHTLLSESSLEGVTK